MGYLKMNNHVFSRDTTAFAFDLDETLFKPNSRDMTSKQEAILTRLSAVTNGAVCFLTNNSGATAHAMFPHVPCISEFGIVWREPNGEKTVRLKERTPLLDIDAIDQLLMTRPSFPHPLVKKEVGINFNYFNQAELVQARDLASCIMDAFNLHGFYDVVELVDSVEIVPVDVCKSDAMLPILKRPEFSKRALIMVGDSPADYKCMAKTGFGLAVGQGIVDAPELVGRIPSYKHTWLLLDGLVDAFEVNAAVDFSRLAHDVTHGSVSSPNTKGTGLQAPIMPRLIAAQ